MQAIKRTLRFIHRHPLAQKHLSRAYFNFIIWQIKSRLTNDFIIQKFIHGTRFWAKKGLTGITGNIYSGLHEFHDMGFLLHFLRAEDTFFDVGANVGAYTILASGVCGAKSLTFEPIQLTFSILQENLRLNQIEHLVKAHQSGVGKNHCIIRFSTKEDTTNHALSPEEGLQTSTEVDIVPLDSYYPDYTPALIKIDVEGFESEVLRGMEKLLSNKSLKAIIIELNGSGARYGYHDDQVHNQLIRYNFRPYNYCPFTRKLIELKQYGDYNTIYISDLPFVESRVQTAPGFRVFNEKI